VVPVDLAQEDAIEKWTNLDSVFPSSFKIKGKDRPTFLLRQNNLVNKVSPETIMSGSLG
jgi:hypothetical protein